MTSKLPEHLFDDIGDVRKKYADDVLAQNFVLQRTYPLQFKNRNAERAPSYRPEPKFKFNLNFDAAVVVLRHLYSMILVDLRNSDRIATDELSHPILRFMWADFEDESSVAAQTILRYEMQTLDDPRGDMTVFQLFERPAMWDSIWNREPFRLYHQHVFGRPKDAAEWTIIENQEDVVEESLVEWNGAKDLGDEISSLFGQSVDIETGDEYVEMFNDPAIIRVRYQHTAPGRPPATYQDLRQILIAPRRIRRDENNPARFFRINPEEDSERVTYTLVAVVRCSDQAGQADRIRLYSMAGHPCSLPMALKDYVGTQWNIGQLNDQGRAYLLFYARAFTNAISGQDVVPIARKEPNASSLIKKMRVSGKDSLGPATGEGSSASASNAH
ncbi:hypothetical protein F5Y03DRAFT_209170 [Xylaria venustula]|nr:hypothetical protein F5Y03DRAFT_209170 [Xylaria venustula]